MSAPFTDREIEAGRKLFSARCDFLLGAVEPRQLPANGLLEICFAGRSNVGKSSLINALTGTRNLARTSNTPGRPRELNFFDLGGRLIICDLPGYGFAKAPKHKVDAWTDLVIDYLKGRRELTRTMLLIDGRHGIKNTDRPIFEILDKAAQVYQVVLTKIDKLKKGELEKRLAETRADLAKHPAAHPEVLATSSDTGMGVSELRAGIVQILDAHG